MVRTCHLLHLQLPRLRHVTDRRQSVSRPRLLCLAWPVDSGYREVRRDLYQLYHLLNHEALFGGHYAAQSQRCIERLLAKV
ncbi:MAG: fructosamine kinase family protein [Salinisphaera sp.]|nr:fructosamine kinase family protein [Salinisphaera sp.]MDN5937767.1 fructosamine kinase family protein [Salinisphaera sp.]